MKLFDMSTANKISALVFHMARPGIGNLAKAGDGYRYVPVPMQLAD